MRVFKPVIRSRFSWNKLEKKFISQFSLDYISEEDKIEFSLLSREGDRVRAVGQRLSYQFSVEHS